MLDNNRERLELAFSLLFALPGTPMLQYGDEIGIGDNLSLPERECARTPMQWSSRKHGGFSSSRRVIRPVVSDPIYGYKRVNVDGQRRDPHSLLNWMERNTGCGASVRRSAGGIGRSSRPPSPACSSCATSTKAAS